MAKKKKYDLELGGPIPSDSKLPKRINSRAKGQRKEREIVKVFAEWWGSDFFRTPGSGAFATRGFTGADISFAGDVVTKDPTFPFCIEVKNCEGWHLEQLFTSPLCDLYAWWDQAVGECPEDKIPLLVFTRNHQPSFIILSEDSVDKRWFDGDVDGWGPFMRLRMGGRPVVIAKLDWLVETARDEWLVPEEE